MSLDALAKRWGSLRVAYGKNVEGAKQRVAESRARRDLREETRRKAELERLRREEAVVDEKLAIKRKHEQLARKRQSLGGPLSGLFGEKPRSRPRRKKQKAKAKPKEKKKAGKGRGGKGKR